MTPQEVLELVAATLRRSLAEERKAGREVLVCPLGHYRLLSHQAPHCGERQR